MAKRKIDLIKKTSRRQFLLMNAVGQMGRYGVKGPVEQAESRVMNIKINKVRSTPRKPKGA